jgi:lysozyme
MTSEELDKLRQELIRDEGLRLAPYTDTVGKLTIGVGRNLSDKGISHDEALMLLDSDIKEHLKLLDDNLEWWRTMSENRQRVLANMAFNMGSKLLTFTNTLAAMKRGDYEVAADGMAQSKWATQVGPRAARLVLMMREG